MVTNASAHLQTSLKLLIHIFPRVSCQTHPTPIHMLAEFIRPPMLYLSCSLNPLSSPSSDAESFDEDDMYGSNSNIETINLRPLLQGSATDTDTSSVHVILMFKHVQLLT